MPDQVMPQIYEKVNWHNTTRVFEPSGDIGFGLKISTSGQVVRYKFSVGEARDLAETLLEFINPFLKSGPSLKQRKTMPEVSHIFREVSAVSQLNKPQAVRVLAKLQNENECRLIQLCDESILVVHPNRQSAIESVEERVKPLITSSHNR